MNKLCAILFGILAFGGLAYSAPPPTKTSPATPSSPPEVPPVVNPGELLGFGPFRFGMTSAEAYRATKGYGKYHEVTLDIGNKSIPLGWAIDYAPPNEPTVSANLGNNETVYSISVTLLSGAVVPRDICFEDKLKLFHEYVLLYLPNTNFYDTNSVKNDTTEIIRRIAYSNGSHARLSISYYSSSRSCHAYVSFFPEKHT